jgi:ATP-binding cassette subfamily B protein
VELSIGEWQKIALTRGFFREAQLLVVDEPTSALDAVAEVELFHGLDRLVRGRATLLISHRFSTVRMADRIYVVEDGRILESGFHEELLLRGGKHAHLFRLQAAPYQDDGVRARRGRITPAWSRRPLKPDADERSDRWIS